MQQNKNYIRLDEITLMRFVLAILIVLLHSFTCFQGVWAEPEGFIEIDFYKWIARFCTSFTLESFVFISGYLLAFQIIFLKRKVRGKNLLISKFKRLIVPSIFFSFFYFLFFLEYKGFGNALYSVINGSGHMWFLPMLFWCFMGAWLIEKLRINDYLKLFLLLLLNLFWPKNLPLQMTAATDFLYFFYLGYIVYKHSSFSKKIFSGYQLIMGWGVYLVVFYLLFSLKLSIHNSDFITYKLLPIYERNLCQISYATLGTLLFYLTAKWYTRNYTIHSFTVKISSLCFGIYLFQQFILKGLYYKTGFTSLVGPYWFPWLGFIITLFLSSFLSLLFVKNRLGRFLIG